VTALRRSDGDERGVVVVAVPSSPLAPLVRDRSRYSARVGTRTVELDRPGMDLAYARARGDGAGDRPARPPRRCGHLAVVAVIKNEAAYLREWLEFHLELGVDHFYLYDNDSSDGFEAVLDPYRRAGVVDLVRWPQHPCQAGAYRDAHWRYRRETRWLAALDLDEFLWSPTGLKLPEVLARFGDAAGVVANWRVFGTGGHVSRPEGLVIENYRLRTVDDDPINRHVKSIVDPRRVRRPSSPHAFEYLDGGAVGEEGDPVPGRVRERLSADLLRINHYIAKCEDDARAKWARGRADATVRYEEDWLLSPAFNAIEDDGRIVELYADAVRARLGLGDREGATA
jgi:hypothetical protein